ncbi:hypothetical protein Vi05172_g13338 [Venturia inaequalis]|nr:hypothetical protein Vi05172_g13338 [Venturia inaequalis]
MSIAVFNQCSTYYKLITSIYITKVKIIHKSFTKINGLSYVKIASKFVS